MFFFNKTKKKSSTIYENFDGNSGRYWYTFNNLKFSYEDNGVRLYGSGETLGFGVDTNKGENGTAFIIGDKNCIEFDITGTCSNEIRLELTDFNNTQETIVFTINEALPHQKIELYKVKEKISKIQFIFSAEAIDVKLANMSFGKTEKIISRVFLPTLAFDIGEHSIKMILVDNNQNPLLFDYAEIPQNIPAEMVPTEISRLLRSLIFKHKLKAQQLAFVISDKLIVHRRLIFKTDEHRDNWAYFFQKKLADSIPFPAENNILNYQPNSSDNTDFFISTAPRSVLDPILQITRKMNVKTIFTIDIVFCLQNIYKEYYPKDGPTTAIIDLGTHKTTVAIFNGEKILFARNFLYGGSNFTKQLAADLSLPTAEAEQRKVHSLEYNSEESASIAAALKNWVGDVQRTFEYYVNEKEALPLQNIILCGGGSLLPGIAPFVQDTINVPTELFLENTEVLTLNKILKSSSRQAPLFAAALGLALEKIDKKNTRNMLHEPSRDSALYKKNKTDTLDILGKSFYDLPFFRLKKKTQLIIIAGTLFFFFIFLPGVTALQSLHLKQIIAQKELHLVQLEAAASSANARIQDYNQADQYIKQTAWNKKTNIPYRTLKAIANYYKDTITKIDIDFIDNTVHLQGISSNQWNISQLVSKLQSSSLFSACNLVSTTPQGQGTAFHIQGVLAGGS